MHIRELFRAGARFGSAEKPLFDSGWIADPEASPPRRRWIAWLRELGLFDAVELPRYDCDRMPHR
ncbi:Hypothetical protein A7982_05168 [Minicystis rosea]|nr:Hypothetical protein A7982_05168 [Minicystis rosea]